MSGARKLTRADWAKDPDSWAGRISGTDLGTDLTILFVDHTGPGFGPGLHVHPYDEVFLIREGTARYWVGGEVIDAGPGDVVFGPAEVPHRFETTGAGRFVSIDLHLSPEFIQTDLE